MAGNTGTALTVTLSPELEGTSAYGLDWVSIYDGSTHIQSWGDCQPTCNSGGTVGNNTTHTFTAYVAQDRPDVGPPTVGVVAVGSVTVTNSGWHGTVSLAADLGIVNTAHPNTTLTLSTSVPSVGPYTVSLYDGSLFIQTWGACGPGTCVRGLSLPSNTTHTFIAYVSEDRPDPGPPVVDLRATSAPVTVYNIGAAPLPPYELTMIAANGKGGANRASNVTSCQSTASPVTCSSGDFWHGFTDVAVPGRGGGLGVSRTYNSLSAATSGPFGYGWSPSFGSSLAFDGSGNATITQGNGSQVTFTPDGSGGFIAAGGEFTALVHNGDGTYTYTLRSRQTFTYSAGGQLVSTSDLDGNTITYGYTGGAMSSMTDAAGRSITLAYGTNGLVSTVTDPLSRVTSYGYDTSGNLTSSTDPSSRVTHYSYDGNHLMLTMTDPNSGVVTNTFDGTGRVLTQTDPKSRLTQFAYAGDNFSAAGGSTTITDPAGFVTVQNYADGALTSLTKGFGTAAAATWTYTIDPATLATTGVSDPNGHASSQTFDAAGNTTSVTDADGRTTHATFDALGDALTRTDSAGVTTTYAYTATGDLLTSSTPLGGGAVTASNTYGDPTHPGDITSVTDPNTHSTSFGYDTYGDVTSVTDADGDKSSATFDVDGEKLTSVAADGNVTGCGCAASYTTTNTYFANGQLHTSTDPLGGITTLGYDGNGNTTSVQDATLLTTSSTFDADNELTKVTQPDGTYVSYGYDADGRRNSVANGTQPAALSTFDVLGDVLTVTDPSGKQTVNTYDLGGRLASSKSANLGTTLYTYFNGGAPKTVTSPTGGVTSDSYDTAGRLATVTDPDGNITSYAYDALGRQTTTTRADTATTVNGYDNAGQLTSYTDARAKVTSYAYTPAGREKSTTDPNLRVTQFVYDATGNQTTLTDALSRLTTNTFDADNRITKTVYTGSTTPQVTYTYDAAGRRKTMVDGTGTTTTAYDAFGRVANVTDGATNNVAYTYDTLGRIATLKYPDGHVVTRGYDANDRFTTLTDWNTKVTTFGYDPDGNLTTTTHPNGVVDTTTLNGADQPTGITIQHGATNLATFGYTPDPAGQLSAATDSLTSSLSTSYTYTKLNQVAKPANATATYAYDNSGNLTGLSNGTAMTYDPAGQLQTSTPSGGQATTFGFDGVGDRTTTSAPNPGTPGTIGSEVNSSADGVSGAGTVTTSTFSTTHTNEVFLALVSAGPGTGTQTATVTGAGLTWTMVARSNTQAGDAEIWSATAPGLLASQKVTATQTSHGGKLSLEVMSFYGASGVGAHTTASAATGAAHVSVTTTGANSRTFAVGYDGTATGATTVASGQTLTHSQSTSGATGNTWMQKTTSATAASGTAVNLADTAPTTLAWNMAGVEVLATPIPAAPTVTTDTYDQVGELTSTVKTGGTATTYTYNGDGLRATSLLSGVTTKYAWDNQGSVPLLLADNTNDYLYGPSGNVVEQIAKTGGATTYLHADRIGSTRVITDSAGTTVGTTSYDPYGNPIAHTGTATTPFGYSGQYTDPTGLSYLRARYYDPATGQFLTIDPMVGDTKTPYSYVDGNPLNATDPTGLCGIFGSGPCPGANALYDVLTHGPGKAVSGAVVNFGRGASFGLSDNVANHISSGASCTVAQNAAWQFVGNFATTVATGGIISEVADSTITAVRAARLLQTAEEDTAVAEEASVAGRTLDELSQQGAQDDKNGLTQAGRALQKHANRAGNTAYPKVPGVELNAAGQDVLDEILTNPLTAERSYVSSSYGPVRDFLLPNMGARFEEFGRLIGFL